MFTGLVQSLGTIERAESDGHGGLHLTLREASLAIDLTVGESIAVEGVCLTVVRFEGESFDFQVGPETLKRTTLGTMSSGQEVNLERSLRVGDRLGGHFVTGHIDSLGRLLQRERSGDWEMVRFEFDPVHRDLLIPKGSIAIDGVSLTIVDVEGASFSVMLIPHTLAVTSLGRKQPGAQVNLEFDMLGKYVHNIMKNMTVTV